MFVAGTLTERDLLCVNQYYKTFSFLKFLVTEPHERAQPKPPTVLGTSKNSTLVWLFIRCLRKASVGIVPKHFSVYLQLNEKGNKSIKELYKSTITPESMKLILCTAANKFMA